MPDENKRKRSKDDEAEELPFKCILELDKVITKLLKSYISYSIKAAARAGGASSSSSKPLTLADLSLSSSCREVADLSLSSMETKIETIIVQIAGSILAGDGFSFSVPSHASSNQLYVLELGLIVLKDKSTLRPFAFVSSVKKTTITTRILALIDIRSGAELRVELGAELVHRVTDGAADNLFDEPLTLQPFNSNHQLSVGLNMHQTESPSCCIVIVALFFPYLGFVPQGLSRKVFNEATSFQSLGLIIHQQINSKKTNGLGGTICRTPNSEMLQVSIPEVLAHVLAELVHVDVLA